ncbi:MAG: MFS transporter, partial [Thermodesulfobacteriota bacterium]
MEKRGNLVNKVNQEALRLLLIAFMVAHAANDGFNAIFPPLLPLIREHFHLSYAQLGGFLSLFRFFGSFLQIPVSYLSHFIPSSTIMVSGLLWLSTGMLLATFAGSYWMLASAFSFAGIGRASYHPLSFSLLSRVFPKKRLGRIVGLHMGASSAAHLIAPFLVILLANKFGWYWPIRLWCLYGIMAASFLLVVLRRHIGKEEKVEGKALRLPFISSSLVFYCLFRICWAIARNGMSTFLPLFLVEKAHFSIKVATLYYIAMYLMEVITRPMIGAYSDKVGKRKPVILGECVLFGVLFLSLTIFQTQLVLLIIILGIGLFAGTIPVVAQTYAIEMIPSEHRERTLGFVFTISTTTTTFTPLIIGFLADYLGLIQSFIILPSLIGVGMFF